MLIIYNLRRATRLHHHQRGLQPCVGLGLLNHRLTKHSVPWLGHSAEIIRDTVNPSHFWPPPSSSVVNLCIWNSVRHTRDFHVLNMSKLLDSLKFRTIELYGNRACSIGALLVERANSCTGSVWKIFRFAIDGFM